MSRFGLQSRLVRRAPMLGLRRFGRALRRVTLSVLSQELHVCSQHYYGASLNENLKKKRV